MKTVKLFSLLIWISSFQISFAQKTIPAGFKIQMQTILTDYFQLKSALIHQDLKKAGAASGELSAASASVKPDGLSGMDLSIWNKNIGPVRSAAKKINGSADAVRQLADFSGLSISLYSLTKYFKISTQKLYYDYCPMANGGQGGYWLSNNKEIVNPYLKGIRMGCEQQKDSF